MPDKNFDVAKKRYLELLKKKDRSKKGFVDKEIKHLIKIINKHNDYYTTSSCAGRILLIKKADGSKKNDAEWLFVSHNRIRFVELNFSKLKSSNLSGTLWFKTEPFILHVCCRDLARAQQIIDLARYVGLKKSGIMASRNRIVAEIVGTDLLEVPISLDGSFLPSEDYMKFLVFEANKKLQKNNRKVESFVEAFKKIR